MMSFLVVYIEMKLNFMKGKGSDSLISVRAMRVRVPLYLGYS